MITYDTSFLRSFYLIDSHTAKARTRLRQIKKFPDLRCQTRQVGAGRWPKTMAVMQREQASAGYDWIVYDIAPDSVGLHDGQIRAEKQQFR